MTPRDGLGEQVEGTVTAVAWRNKAIKLNIILL
jgi:hypothetical protein